MSLDKIGKFQMQVLSGCGHSVHEDAPDKVSTPILLCSSFKSDQNNLIIM